MTESQLTDLEKIGLAHTLGAAIALVDFLISKHGLNRKEVVHGTELAKIKLESPDAPSNS